MASTELPLEHGGEGTAAGRTSRQQASDTPDDHTASHNIPGCIAHLQARTALGPRSMERSSASQQGLDLISLNQQLSSILCNVRRLRNAVLPIMRFPPETLGRIFEIVQAEAVMKWARSMPTYEFKFAEAACDPRDWTYIRQVCRHWHDVADAHPALWTTILAVVSDRDGQYSNPAHIEASLRNSSNHPLTVYMNFTWTHHPALTHILTNLPRVRDMELVVTHPPVNYIVQLDAQSGASTLRSLRLLLVPPRTASNIAYWTSPVLFRYDTPALRSVEITQVSSAAPFSFRSLTQLRLGLVAVCNHWAGVARLLQNSSSTLEDFGLFEVVNRVRCQEPPDYRPPVSSSDLPLQLPRLKKLVFDDVDEESVAEVLGLVRFSAHTPVFIYWDLASSTPFIQTMLMDLFHTDGRVGRAGLTHLLEGISRVQIYVGEAYKGVYASGDAFAFHFRQTFGQRILKPFSIHPFPIIDRILSKAQELWLDTPSELYPSERECFLVHARGTVKLYCALGSQHRLKALHVVPNTRTPAGTIPILWPLLREVHLLDPRDVMFSPTFLPTLLEWLTARERHDFPLQVLYIYRIEGLRPLPKLEEQERNEADNSREPSAADWDEWAARVSATLGGLSVVVRFLCLESSMRPHMYAPPHCMVQSGGGEWKWQTWDAEY